MADETNRRCDALSMACDRESCHRGRSMSSGLTQSGREAEEAKAATVDMVWGGEVEELPRIHSTQHWASELEARNAAGACREALRRLRPPRQQGRVAFSHAQSDIGPPKIYSSALRMAESKSLAAFSM